MIISIGALAYGLRLSFLKRRLSYGALHGDGALGQIGGKGAKLKNNKNRCECL